MDHGDQTGQDRKAAKKPDAWTRTAELQEVKKEQASRSKEGRGEEMSQKTKKTAMVERFVWTFSRISTQDGGGTW